MPLRALFCLLTLLLLTTTTHAMSPVAPIPLHPSYDAQRAALGLLLFSDRRLDADGDRACADCHRLDQAASGGAQDGLHGHGPVAGVNAPSLFNSRHNFRRFWNGRAQDLRGLIRQSWRGQSAQAIDALLTEDPTYRTRFATLYPGQTPGLPEVIDALAEFIDALTTPNARFDRWLRGELTLTEQEQLGYQRFKQLGCISCHNGINIGGNSYQYQGAVVPMQQQSLGADRFALTGDPFDHNRYRVPSLRNVALTAPYLHDGSVTDLRALLYLHAYHNIGFQLTPDEVESLVAFLDSLTGERPAVLDAR